jgi:hypothetical protein
MQFQVLCCLVYKRVFQSVPEAGTADIIDVQAGKRQKTKNRLQPTEHTFLVLNRCVPVALTPFFLSLFLLSLFSPALPDRLAALAQNVLCL